MQYVRTCKLPVLVKEGKIIVLYYLALVIFYSLIVGMEIGEKYNLDQCKHRKANELLELSENVNLSEKIVKESAACSYVQSTPYVKTYKLANIVEKSKRCLNFLLRSKVYRRNKKKMVICQQSLTS